MKHIFSLILLATGAVMLSSCGLTKYMSRSQDIAIVEQKGDWQVAGGFAAGDAYNASVTYAATDRVVVQVAGSFSPYTEAGNGNPVGRVAVGRYSMSSWGGYFALYGGAEYQRLLYKGSDYVYDFYDGPCYRGVAHYPSLFAQMDLGLRPYRWFECGLRLTLGGVGYIDHGEVSRAEWDAATDTLIWGPWTDNSSSGVVPLAQTAAVLRFGLSDFAMLDLKAGMDWGYYIGDALLHNGNPTREVPIYFGLGLSLRFPTARR